MHRWMLKGFDQQQQARMMKDNICRDL
ncbi:MAG: hypothetical protein EZS28_040176, partial [Streblomastix strix]